MIRDDDEFIERRIITGLIVSDDYIRRVEPLWNPTLLESPELRMVGEWCLDYFRKYDRAPDRDIESIYMEHLRNESIPKADAQYIEEVLASLSDEYGRGSQFNAPYLYDKTIRYFKAKDLERHSEKVQALVDAGKVDEAEQLLRSYQPAIVEDSEKGIELSDEETLDRIDRAFSEVTQSVLQYPGALGKMLNPHLTRGAFVSFLAPEKRGKSWTLIDMGLRGIRQRANVAFFVAGDMTESQVLRRICIHIAQKSDMEQYCQERFRPVGDCVLNQLDLCDRAARNCDHGIFDNLSLEMFKQGQDQFINIKTLMQKYEENPDYRPCDAFGCTARIGSVWLEKVDAVKPLDASEAKERLRAFFQRYKRRFRLITYPAGVLTVTEMRRCLDDWERYDGFVPDIVIVDYADILSSDDAGITEFRHRQDHVWKSLRALSQERHCLLITATQADAESYKKGRLNMTNFSEDKRKLAHVTAQFGLNQDPDGREKALGIMRINEIVVREGSFSADSEVHVLQDLAAGRPFLESY